MLYEVTEVSPYNGAKPHFLISELEDKEFLTDLIKITYEQLTAPKPKKESLKNRENRPRGLPED